MDYCRNLQLAGHSDWRLATIDELQGIYEPSAKVRGRIGDLGSTTWHVKGNIRLTGIQWSNSEGSVPGAAWYFSFYKGDRVSAGFGDGINNRALCVRRSGG
jgi:hypothetical protein